VTVAKGANYPLGTTVLSNELLKLVFQQDGNLVLYRGGGTDWDALWASGTDGKGASKLAFQQDGNLVIYATRGGKDVPIWDTKTSGRNVSKLALQDDCNLVLYDGNGKPWWASSTAGQMAVIEMESGFTFAGQSYHIARFRLAAKPDTFAQLPSILADKIEAVLVDAYKDATKWVDATKKGCIDGVNDTGKVLRDYYKKSADETNKLMGQATNAVSNTASSTWSSTKKTIKKAKFW
jgi:hypothetical protein